MKLIVNDYPFCSTFQFWYKHFFGDSITINFPITIEASEDILRKFIETLQEEIRLGKDFLISDGEFEFELIHDAEPHLIKAQLWFDNLPPLEQSYVKTLIRQNERQ